MTPKHYKNSRNRFGQALIRLVSDCWRRENSPWINWELTIYIDLRRLDVNLPQMRSIFKRRHSRPSPRVRHTARLVPLNNQTSEYTLQKCAELSKLTIVRPCRAPRKSPVSNYCPPVLTAQWSPDGSVLVAYDLCHQAVFWIIFRTYSPLHKSLKTRHCLHRSAMLPRGNHGVGNY